MKSLFLILAILLTASFVEAKVAELWDITLTNDQVILVNAAGAKGATITLTTSQFNAIKQKFPNITKNTLLVKPSEIDSNKKICGNVGTNGCPVAVTHGNDWDY